MLFNNVILSFVGTYDCSQKVFIQTYLFFSVQITEQSKYQPKSGAKLSETEEKSLTKLGFEPRLTHAIVCMH